MKNYIIAITLLMIANMSFANSTSETLAQIITENEQQEILQIIDQNCADTWCAGDYEYKFTNFKCNDEAATCTLSFKIISRDAKPEENNSKNRRCTFKNITSKDKIFRDSSLNEEFYDQLNYCVSKKVFTAI